MQLLLLCKKTKDDSIKIEESFDDGCFAKCHADIYYFGKKVHTEYSSSYSSDCVSAQTSCLESVNVKALKYIAEVDAVLAQ